MAPSNLTMSMQDYLRLKAKILGTDLLMSRLSEIKRENHLQRNTIQLQRNQLQVVEKRLASQEMDIKNVEAEQQRMNEVNIKLAATEQHNIQLQALLKQKCSELATAKQERLAKHKTDPTEDETSDLHMEKFSRKSILHTVIHFAELLSKNGLLSSLYKAKMEKWKETMKAVEVTGKNNSDTECLDEDDEPSKDQQKQKKSDSNQITESYDSIADDLKGIDCDLHAIWNDLCVPRALSPTSPYSLEKERNIEVSEVTSAPTNQPSTRSEEKSNMKSITSQQEVPNGKQITFLQPNPRKVIPSSLLSRPGFANEEDENKFSDKPIEPAPKKLDSPSDEDSGGNMSWDSLTTVPIVLGDKIIDQKPRRKNGSAINKKKRRTVPALHFGIHGLQQNDYNSLLPSAAMSNYWLGQQASLMQPMFHMGYPYQSFSPYNPMFNTYQPYNGINNYPFEYPQNSRYYFPSDQLYGLNNNSQHSNFDVGGQFSFATTQRDKIDKDSSAQKYPETESDDEYSSSDSSSELSITKAIHKRQKSVFTAPANGQQDTSKPRSVSIHDTTKQSKLSRVGPMSRYQQANEPTRDTSAHTGRRSAPATGNFTAATAQGSPEVMKTHDQEKLQECHQEKTTKIVPTELNNVSDEVEKYIENNKITETNSNVSESVLEVDMKERSSSLETLKTTSVGNLMLEPYVDFSLFDNSAEYRTSSDTDILPIGEDIELAKVSELARESNLTESNTSSVIPDLCLNHVLPGYAQKSKEDLSIVTEQKENAQLQDLSMPLHIFEDLGGPLITLEELLEEKQNSKDTIVNVSDDVTQNAHPNLTTKLSKSESPTSNEGIEKNKTPVAPTVAETPTYEESIEKNIVNQTSSGSTINKMGTISKRGIKINIPKVINTTSFGSPFKTTTRASLLLAKLGEDSMKIVPAMKVNDTFKAQSGAANDNTKVFFNSEVQMSEIRNVTFNDSQQNKNLALVQKSNIAFNTENKNTTCNLDALKNFRFENQQNIATSAPNGKCNSGTRGLGRITKVSTGATNKLKCDKTPTLALESSQKEEGKGAGAFDINQDTIEVIPDISETESHKVGTAACTVNKTLDISHPDVAEANPSISEPSQEISDLSATDTEILNSNQDFADTRKDISESSQQKGQFQFPSNETLVTNQKYLKATPKNTVMQCQETDLSMSSDSIAGPEVIAPATKNCVGSIQNSIFKATNKSDDDEFVMKQNDETKKLLSENLPFDAKSLGLDLTSDSSDSDDHNHKNKIDLSNQTMSYTDNEIEEADRQPKNPLKRDISATSIEKDPATIIHVKKTAPKNAKKKKNESLGMQKKQKAKDLSKINKLQTLRKKLITKRNVSKAEKKMQEMDIPMPNLLSDTTAANCVVRLTRSRICTILDDLEEEEEDAAKEEIKKDHRRKKICYSSEDESDKNKLRNESTGSSDKPNDNINICEPKDILIDEGEAMPKREQTELHKSEDDNIAAASSTVIDNSKNSNKNIPKICPQNDTACALKVTSKKIISKSASITRKSSKKRSILARCEVQQTSASPPMLPIVKIKQEKFDYSTAPILIDLTSDDEETVSVPNEVCTEPNNSCQNHSQGHQPLPAASTQNEDKTTENLKSRDPSKILSNQSSPVVSLDLTKSASPIIGKNRKRAILKPSRLRVPNKSNTVQASKSVNIPSPKILPSDRVGAGESVAYKKQIEDKSEDGLKPPKVRLSDLHSNTETQVQKQVDAVSSIVQINQCQMGDPKSDEPPQKLLVVELQQVNKNAAVENPSNIVKRFTRQSARLNEKADLTTNQSYLSKETRLENLARVLKRKRAAPVLPKSRPTKIKKIVEKKKCFGNKSKTMSKIETETNYSVEEIDVGKEIFQKDSELSNVKEIETEKEDNILNENNNCDHNGESSVSEVLPSTQALTASHSETSLISTDEKKNYHIEEIDVAKEIFQKDSELSDVKDTEIEEHNILKSSVPEALSSLQALTASQAEASLISTVEMTGDTSFQSSPASPTPTSIPTQSFNCIPIPFTRIEDEDEVSLVIDEDGFSSSSRSSDPPLCSGEDTSTVLDIPESNDFPHDLTLSQEKLPEEYHCSNHEIPAHLSKINGTSNDETNPNLSPYVWMPASPTLSPDMDSPLFTKVKEEPDEEYTMVDVERAANRCYAANQLLSVPSGLPWSAPISFSPPPSPEIDNMENAVFSKKASPVCENKKKSVADIFLNFKADRKNKSLNEERLRFQSNGVKYISGKVLQDLSKDSFDIDLTVSSLQASHSTESLSNIAEAMLLLVAKKQCKKEVDINKSGCCLTVTQWNCLSLVNKLEKTSQFVGITATLLTLIPSCIVDVNKPQGAKKAKKFKSLEQLCALTRVFVCLCRHQHISKPIRSLLYDALCHLRTECSALTFEILTLWPDVIPGIKGNNNVHSKYTSIKDLPIKIQCIVYALLSYKPEEDVLGNYKIAPLLELLQSQHNYIPKVRSAQNLLQHIIDKLQGGEVGGVEVEKGLQLLCCCEGVEWTKKHVVRGELYSMLDNHSASPQADQTAQVAAKVMGLITGVMPRSQHMFVKEVLQKLENVLQNGACSEGLCESVCFGVLFLKNVVEMPRLMESLSLWVPKQAPSEKFLQQLNSHTDVL